MGGAFPWQFPPGPQNGRGVVPAVPCPVSLSLLTSACIILGTSKEETESGEVGFHPSKSSDMQYLLSDDPLITPSKTEWMLPQSVLTLIALPSTRIPAI